MATEFPEGLDAFVNPQPTDSVAAVSHAAQHANTNDAIAAIQIKIGVNDSLDPTSLDYRIKSLENAALDPEEVQDLISQLLTSGSGITTSYDDELNIFTISVDTSTIATKEFASQEAADAEAAAKLYADGLAVNYDPVGSAAQALIDANQYTDTQIEAVQTDLDNYLTAANEYTDEAVASLGNQVGQNYVPISSLTQPDGVATLDSAGKVPLNQLDIDESIQDVAAEMITSGTHTNLSVSYNDITGTLNFTALGGGGGGASVTVSPNPPSEPSLGDLWLDSDNARAYAYDGEFWAEIGSGGQLASISTTPPASAVQGQVWLDSDNAKSYIYDGMYWVEI